MQTQTCINLTFCSIKKKNSHQDLNKMTFAEELCEAGWLDHVFSRNNLNQT